MTRHADAVRVRHMLDNAREAAARVTAEYRTGHPEIPWPQVVAMRNRLVHGYDTVDLDVLWDTITEDLPPLVVELEKLVAD